MHPETTETGQTAIRSDPAADSSVSEDIRSLWRELLGLSYEHFRLAGLETRRAGESLVAMIVAGIMLAVLLVGAWLGLLAAAVLFLIGQGWATSGAILFAVAVNLLAALMLYALIRHKSHYLQLPAFLRSLEPKPAKSRKDLL
ncbi:MAG: hypothetical protein CTY16_12300 [Methylobacter sp.]|nr:MAG: hypothetical protein CTY16_12300 [Methylobacter sp.]